jgi:hypothetical protein
MPKTKIAKNKTEAVAALTEIVSGKPGARRARKLIAAASETAQTETLALEVEVAEAELEFSRPVGMVPLAEQVLEGELIESSGDRAANVLPWKAWNAPEVRSYDLPLLRIEGGEDGLTLSGPEGPLGPVTAGFLDGLGIEATFPCPFVEKLSPALAALVINERVQRAPAREVAVIREEGRCTRLAPGNREILPAGDVADVVWESLQAAHGSLEIEACELVGGEMSLRLFAPVQEPVTRSVGDVLRFGVQVEHNYRQGTTLDLYALRLICLNGMTADRRAFSWKVREERTKDGQIAWLRHALGELPRAFERIVERSRLMAETRFTGDYQAVIRQSAQAMRLHRRHVEAVVAAFEEEPGDNYWTLLNAFTRAGTHANFPPTTRRAVLAAAGDWAGRWEMCTASLPRPMALACGATILED